MSADDTLLVLLRAIRDGDDAGEPLDSDMLSSRLGWSATDVAAGLSSARERMLIWGARVGGSPAPRFADLEITVQGRRLMSAMSDAGNG